MTEPEGPTTTVLCLNAGSSSLKGALVRDGSSDERSQVELGGTRDLVDAVDHVLDDLVPAGEEPPVVCHRVVHGGPEFLGPTIITNDVIERLRALVPLAPLHQPAAIIGIELLRRRMPSVPHVACFDTAFHHRLPADAQRLPLPDRYWELGVRRYGFHGLSYEFVVGHLGDRLAPRTVVAHLGGGSSLVALHEGTPVDTTMSLTPGGGLVMATRSGDLDPGVVLHLLRIEGSAARVASILEEHSGMRALSGGTSDVRRLVQASRTDERARRSVDAFVASVAEHVGAFVTVLGGLDLLVFTGGVGSGSHEIRAAVASRLGHLGVRIADEPNRRGDELVSDPAAPCTVLSVETDEERVMAAQARRLLEWQPEPQRAP